MVIVYIHGFASVFDEQNEKVTTLRDAGYTVKGLQYEGSDPVRDFESLKDQMSKIIVEHIDDEVAVIGTSLGGYYARFLGAIFGIKTILVNPCLHPEKTMLRNIGKDVRNYATQKKIVISESTIEGYHKLNEMFGKLCSEKLVLLDKDDEVLFSEATKKELQYEAHIVMFDGGNHRFQHMEDALSSIDQYLNNYN